MFVMPAVARLARAPDVRPSRGIRVLHRQAVVAAPIDETFAFFADARNLERLTPKSLNFTIRTATPIEMRSGVEIDYLVRLYRIPIPWRSRIDVWEPGVRFVDRQLVGPYRWWVHEHRFETVPGGTRVTDRVEYVPRARWVSARVVDRDLEKIFAFRTEALQRLFCQPERGTPRRGHPLPKI